MKYLIIFLLLGPLSIAAQNCTEETQKVLADSEGLLSDTEGELIDETATTYNVPCPTQKATLFPNPCLDMIQIEGLESGDTEGSIFGIDGRLQMRVKLKGEIDVSRLAQGVYFLRTKNRTFKFLKL